MTERSLPELGLGPLIAIVGSDGAGKSTVGDVLLAWLRESRTVEICHLGKKTGDLGRAIARLPMVGPGIHGRIRKTGERAQTGAGAGLLAAIVLYRTSMRRVRRFRRMMAIRRRGVTVIADRYPQLAVLGPKMDGPHLIAEAPKSIVVRLLARRERALYEWMTSYPPDLVIRLNVDYKTAMARKPDHDPASLAARIEAVQRLSFGSAPIVDIDSTRPLAEVLDLAKTAVSLALDRPRPM